jgi:autotransporter-associated beta strand protein
MTLTDSISAKAGASAVSAIASSTATFRHFVCYLSTTILTAITGTTGLIKNGIGGLTLSGVCNYTGPTQINAGQIAISSASTLNGVISGAGSLTKTGTTALTIGGSNTYSGGTLSAPSAATGTITFSQNNAFGTGLFTSAGQSQIITASSATLTNDFQINAVQSLQFRVNTATTILTLSGNIAGSGALNKTSTGQLRLNGTLTYTGSTTITAGTLRASKTTGASTATASFTTTALSVSFNVAPPSGTTTFRFFQGTTVNSYASVTLVGVPVGTTATYTSATSTLAVTVL